MIRGWLYFQTLTTYLGVKNLIHSSLTDQIIKLSTTETKVFDLGAATNKEMDAKLDLASARENLPYLKLYSQFPYASQFKWMARFLSLLSIASLVFGPLLIK